MKTTTFVLLFAILLAACAPAAIPTPTPIPPTATVPPPTVPPPTATVSPPSAPVAEPKVLGADLDAAFQEATKNGAFSGAVLVAKNGQMILSQGYGFANRAQNIPNTPQTKFRIGGLTHGFAALAILILQEQGKLTVQDKLCTYLTDCPEAWKPITLYHLLTRSSGTQYTWDPHTPMDKMIADAKTKSLAFQPGARCDMFNLDYPLLGKVIEATSGQTFEAFLQKNIFEPLQMSSTGYDHRQADLALGYAGTGNATVDLWDPEALFSAGALYSSAEDLYRWDQALYTETLVSQKLLDAMFTPSKVPMPSDWSPGWATGYSWVIAPGKPLLLEQDNEMSGYTSVIQRYPEDKSVIIVLSNQEGVDAWTNADLVAKKMFGVR
jgi:CubicO group peptidase (beta-lactamase class C family)